MQRTYSGPGRICNLSSLLNSLAPERVLLVTGNNSFDNLHGSQDLSSILNQYSIARFRCLSENPTLTELEYGLETSSEFTPDVIVGIGGGRVLDMAKLIRIGNAQDGSILDIAQGNQAIVNSGPPLIAIPTTSGSGSQATHFAVLYIDGVKYSIAHRLLKPDFVILDSELTYTLPKLVTAVTGVDALCQAIESYWNVASTDSSKIWAKSAIQSILLNIESAVHEPSPRSREAMCGSSHLAGRAIDITKTTGPHALSYGLAAACRIPHGHSVGLTLGSFIEFNALVSETDNNDPRGVSYARGIVADICSLLGASTAYHARLRFTTLMESIGLSTRLSSFGITDPSTCISLAAQVNSERLGNNPRQPTVRQLEDLLIDLL